MFRLLQYCLVLLLFSLLHYLVQGHFENISTRSGHKITQAFSQGPEIFFITPPAFQRRGINGLAHLGNAGGLYCTSGLVGLQASVIPFPATVVDQSACLVFIILHQFFIVHVIERALRQDLAPVLHDPVIIPVKKALFIKVIALVLAVPEQAGEPGDAGIQRITHNMNNLRIWKN